AIASSERLRRLSWTAASVAAGAVALSTVLGPFIAIDLGHVAAFDLWREALSFPLRPLIPEPEGGIVRGIGLGERASVDADLAIAAMVAVDPSAVVDVGFVLSATATGGLLFLGDAFSSLLRPVPRAIREGLATTLAATVPTLPVIAAVFGRVSLVSPLANLGA